MEKLRYYLQWWFEYEIAPFVEREMGASILDTSLIPVLVGPRRSGKSTIFYQLITHLRKEVPSQNILYVNYEDDRLLPLEGFELAELLNVYRQSFPVDSGYPVYAFLDEIQNLPNWEKSVRRLYETEANLKMFLTGSNSKMLSYDIATALRGRTLSFRIFPLNWGEYLKFKNLDLPELSSLKYSAQTDSLLFECDHYLQYGGFPQVVLSKTIQLKEQILKEYLHTIFFADIIERYEIRQVKVMDAFIKILSRQMSSLFSIGKMHDSLKSIGFNVSKNTLIEYLSYLEEAFLGRSVSIYSYSIKDQLQYPRKFYLSDNGLYLAASYVKSEDWGRLLENAVYNHLQRHYEHICYWKSRNGYEVDFVLPDLLGQEHQSALIQVCYDFSDEKVRKREIRSLVKAAREFDTLQGIIITRNTWERIEQDGVRIEAIPFIQWAGRGGGGKE